MLPCSSRRSSSGRSHPAHGQQKMGAARFLKRSALRNVECPRFPDGNRRRPQKVVVDPIPVTHDAKDLTILTCVGDRNGGNRFVHRGVEGLADRLDPPDPQRVELREKLASHHLHALQQRVGRGARLRRIERPIEIVEHLEHVGDDFPAATLDVLRDLASQPQACLFELTRGLAILRQILLELLIFLGELPLGLLDVGFPDGNRGRAQKVVIDPIPAADDADDLSVLTGIGVGTAEIGLVDAGSNGCPSASIRGTPSALELREKLPAHELDALKQRVRRRAASPAASSARSRLSSTSSRSAMISRRPRSMSFEISRRSRSRASSNSLAACRYLPMYS